MKADLIDAVTSPKSDPEFTQKYFFVVLSSVASVLILPGILLVGYLVQTIKHASSGKRGLPEWKSFSDLMIQGGICCLSGLYLLPAALLMAAAWVPVLFDKGGFFSGRAMLSNFITFGALLVGLAGLALSLTGIHTYLQSRRIGDLFNIGPIIAKLKLHSSEVGVLLGFAGAVTSVLYIIQMLLTWPGAILSLLCSPFLALVVAFGTGTIFGTTAAVVPGQESLADGEPAVLLTAPRAETTEESEALPESEVWKPK